MSAWPLIGEGPVQLSEHEIRMAMAIRSTNAHGKMREIHRRHWIALGKRFGVLDEADREMEAIIDDVIARTPRVIAEVAAELTPDFPEHVAGPVLRGLELAASQLVDG